MIYRVEMDGLNIYSYSKELSLLTPHLHAELNSAGSFEFVMPVTHLYYDNPRILTSDIEIFENDESIWFGRVLEITVGMNRNKTILCEGAYAFFNDSIQKPSSTYYTQLHSLFRGVINEHNSQVPFNRQFSIGEITVDDEEIDQEPGYASTKEVLENVCLKLGGGYFLFRKQSGINYIDWVSSLDSYSTQPVEFGLNMVEFSQNISGASIYTSIIPIGKEIDGEKITIKSVNDGLDYIDSAYVGVFGRITKVVEFSDISSPTELKNVAERWLSVQSFDPIRIECSAAELHYLKPDAYSPFKMGQQTRVLSFPHNIDKTIPITSMDIDLDDPVKQTSIGIQERVYLTDYI